MTNAAILSKEDMELWETLRVLDELNDGTLLGKFDEIIEMMKKDYFKDKQDWMIMYSGGKDSSLVLTLVWKMLEQIKPSQRYKRIHVVSADTKVETKQMTKFIEKNLELIQRNSGDLGIKVHFVKPELRLSYFYNVIGKGYKPSTPKDPGKWCVDKLKLQPMEKEIKHILANQPIRLAEEFDTSAQPYQATMLLGSRNEESSNRAASIEKYATDDFYGVHKVFKTVRVFYPIRYVLQSDLWAYLSNMQVLPWGLPVEELEAMYDDGSGECPLTQTDNDSMTSACGSGNSRNGCWTCMFSGPNDKMLVSMINKGFKEIAYMAEWKAFLYDSLNDVRYREPFNRLEVKRYLKEFENQDSEQFDLFDIGLDVHQVSYNHFKRADKTVYKPGGFTFELRLRLLQKLLFTQKMVGYSLIDEIELQAITKNWREEGYTVTKEMIVPINHSYDGPLVLNPNGTVNTKETKTQFPIFYVDYVFNLQEDELVDYLKERQRITVESYYCYIDHKDYEKERFVYNTVRFIICKEGIETQLEATNELHRWLYIKGFDTVDINGNPFEEMYPRSKKAALNHLLYGALGEMVELKREKAQPISFNG